MLQALLPEKRYLFYPNLAKAAGSQPLARRLTALQPDIHIFGHTHFSWDAGIEGLPSACPYLPIIAIKQPSLFASGEALHALPVWQI